MNDLDKIRLEILDAKEKRWLKQKEVISKTKMNLISFKFNIPSWPKSSELITLAFSRITKQFLQFLDKNEINYSINKSDNTSLGPELVMLSENDASILKKLAVEFEESHTIGRLLDIDIINTSYNSIDREIKRQCYFCGKIAIICMREQIHTPEELREYFDIKIDSYLNH